MLSTTVVLRRFSTTRQTDPSCRLFTRAIHRGRINQPRRDLPNPASHSVEDYFVDGDDTLPPNTSLYKVDATSNAAQSAYEPPSGPWSRVGAGTVEYRTTSEDEPYDVPSDPDVKLRHGGQKSYMEDKGPETSKTGEGPEGSERWGRKPEGRV